MWEDVGPFVKTKDETSGQPDRRAEPAGRQSTLLLPLLLLHLLTASVVEVVVTFEMAVVGSSFEMIKLPFFEVSSV